MNLEYQMTNAELADAIEKAWQKTRQTAGDDPNKVETNVHYRFLLEVQKRRSALVATSSEDKTP